jgi:hypothetical protein
MSPREPTFEELKAQRQAEWKAAQTKAAKNLRELNAQIAAMPDVAGAPSPDIQWSHPDIFCGGCATKYFWVKRWVTVNGLRHRAELECVKCGRKDTWDWATQQFMGG